MGKSITNKRIAQNLIITVFAQVISILSNFIFGFIVPKFVSEYTYAYWQIFLLYIGYSGIFHFGLLDGIVLRYSNYDYEELNKAYMSSQFRVLLGITSIVTIICMIVSTFIYDIITREILILVSLGIVTKNLFTYTSYLFQITNRISKYAVNVIAQRAIYAITVVVLLLLRVDNFIWYCLADLFGDIFAIAFGIFGNKGLYFTKGVRFGESLKEAKINISAGAILLIANLTAAFLIGGAKMVIQWRWDELLFGQVSFSFSVANIFVTFATAISVALFPSLKRMEESELPDIYVKIRNAISPLLFFAMILYFPGCWILERWLPNYTDSLVYLGILLPIIIFSSKVSLLTNNYLKAYRKEKLMLVINVASVALGMAAFAIGAYVFNNLELVLYFVVAVIMLRSVASEIAVTNIIKKNITLDFIIELIMTVVFIVTVRLLSLWWACLAYGCALVVYAIIYRKSIVALFHTVINMFKRKKSVNAQHAKE